MSCDDRKRSLPYVHECNTHLTITRRQFLKAATATFSTAQLSLMSDAFAEEQFGLSLGAEAEQTQTLFAVPMRGGLSLFVRQKNDMMQFPVDVLGDTPKDFSDFEILAQSSVLDNPRVHVVRPEDQLDLVIDCENLRILDMWENSTVRLERIESNRRSFISFILNGQSFAEETFFVSAGQADQLEIPLPPVATRFSSPSRLVFEVIGAAPHLEFNLDNLLNWSQFDAELPASPVAKAQVKEPTEQETAIEAPFGLFLSPTGEFTENQYRWRHASKLIGKDGFKENWYTELLGAENPREPSGFDPAELAAVFAVPDDPDIFKSDANERVSLPITAADRLQIVERTHIARPSQTSIKARDLRLSPGGASFNLEAHFPFDCTVQGGSLSSWKHISDRGQVVSARVTKNGVLYPFGHEISILEVTTREQEFVAPTKNEQTTTGKFAKKRLFVVVREPEKFFFNADAPDDNPNAKTLPFKSLRIEDDTTPALDDPFVDSTENSIWKTSEPDKTWQQDAFWPSVSSTPFLFSFSAEDWNGNKFGFHAPAIAVLYDAHSNDPVEGKVAPESLYLQRLADVEKAYKENQDRNVREVSANVAVAQPASALDTTLEVTKIQFSSVGKRDNPICQSPDELFELSVPRFEARVAQLRSLLRDEENIGWFRVQDPQSTQAEIFIKSTSDPDNNFSVIAVGSSGQTETTGGISSLNLKCIGLSRTLGVISSEETSNSGAIAAENGGAGEAAAPEKSTVEEGVFNPTDYLGRDSVLFGGVKLSDILEAGLDVSEAQMPRIVRDVFRYSHVPSKIGQRIDWKTQQFKNFGFDPSNPIFACQQQSPDLIPDKDTPTSFHLLVESSVRLNQELTTRAVVEAQLANFGIQLLFAGNGVLVKFSSLTFSINESGKTDFQPEIHSFELKGPLLAFVAQLQELLGDLFEDTGISVNLTGSGAEVGLPSFALPAFEIGAFSLKNLRINSALILSFRSDPMLFRFNFSSVDDPFLVAVGIYGGEGSILLDLSSRNLEKFEFRLGFGLVGSLDLVVAKGTAAVLGGLRYSSVKITDNGNKTTQITFEFYVRCYGSVRALGIVTVGVDFYLALVVREQGPTSYCDGRVRVRYSVKIGFFKKSFSLQYSKRFSGSSRAGAAVVARNDVEPRQNSYTLASWKRYRAAFVA